jgi:gas vesicle protein
MTKTKDKVTDAADSIRPYVERAMTDEKLRNEVMRAFGTARELYGELIGEKGSPITVASRVATDDDIRDRLREAIEDLRNASERLQGKRERTSNRKSTLLIAGLALGILFNPVTGAETRRFIKDMLSAGDHDADHTVSHSNGRG